MNENLLPLWYAPLRQQLTAMAEELQNRLTGWKPCGRTHTPQEEGYVSGPATACIQAAIDHAAEAGGGTVLLAGGDYVSGSLTLRSNVRLMIAEGARLLASTDLKDFPEHICRRVTVQDTHMGMNQCLIFAEGCENICLCGPGEVDGRGTQENFPGGETQHGTPGRPFLIRMVDCAGVHVHDITLRNAACWMENYFNCDRVLLERLTVRNQVNYNNDGIDIDGCRDVIVRQCDVISGDDALCFKAASERPTERVLVEDCHLYSSCNALKVGTDTQSDFRQVLVRRCAIGGVEKDLHGIKHPCSDSGVSLEMVDGGTLEDFLITDVDIRRAWSPIFLRLEDRGRVRPGLPAPGPGTLHRVAITHVTGCDNGPRGSYMLGVPEQPIADVLLMDVRLAQHPSAKPVTTGADFDEMRGIYPDAHMIDDIGDAPAHALWARHVRGLCLIDYAVTPTGDDPRPAFLFENAEVTTL